MKKIIVPEAMEASIMSLVPRVLNEIKQVFEHVKQDEVDAYASALARAKRVFLFGAGRVGTASRGFAMRLAQLGKMAYWVLDDTTPSIRSEDVFVANSGSGSSLSTFNMAIAAKKAGADVITVTAAPNGKIAALADVVLNLPAQTFKTDSTAWSSVLPMGSQFELCLWILLDIVSMTLMRMLNVGERDMGHRHRNLE